MKYIYFLRSANGDGPVKIGSSADPMKRLETLATWSPLPLEIAAFCPCNGFAETTIHRRFDDHRLHGEWFKPVDELLALIASIKEGEITEIRPTRGPKPQNLKPAYIGKKRSAVEQFGAQWDAWYAEGRMSIVEMSARCGIKATWIAKHLGIAKYSQRTPPLNPTKAAAARHKAEQMLTAYNSGATLEMIGAEYGITRERVRQLLAIHCPDYKPTKAHRAPDVVEKNRAARERQSVRREAIAERKNKRRMEYDRRARIVVDLYQKGHKVADIADVVGLPNRESVFRYLKYMGVPASRHSKSTQIVALRAITAAQA